jgi:hypothetical protein
MAMVCVRAHVHALLQNTHVGACASSAAGAGGGKAKEGLSLLSILDNTRSPLGRKVKAAELKSLFPLLPFGNKPHKATPRPLRDTAPPYATLWLFMGYPLTCNALTCEHVTSHCF